MRPVLIALLLIASLAPLALAQNTKPPAKPDDIAALWAYVVAGGQ